MTVFFMYIILKAIKKDQKLTNEKQKLSDEINIFKTVENTVRQKKQ